MANKKITIEHLATMINKSFGKVATREQVGNLDSKVDNFEKWTKEKINKLDKDVFEIKNLVKDDHRKRLEKLESRVDYLENMLALPNKN